MSYGMHNTINYYRRATTAMIREVDKTKPQDHEWGALVDKFWDACDAQNLRDIEKSHKEIKLRHRKVTSNTSGEKSV